MLLLRFIKINNKTHPTYTEYVSITMSSHVLNFNAAKLVRGKNSKRPSSLLMFVGLCDCVLFLG